MRSVLYWGLITVMGFVAAFIGLSLKESAGIPTNVTLIVYVIGVVVLTFFYEISPWRRLTWRRLSSELVNGASFEKLTNFEAKLRKRWEAGEHSLEVMVSLSHVYLYLKRPADAERFAEQACAQGEVKGLAKHWDWQRRDLRDNAYLAWAEVHKLRGEFAHAAHELDHYRKNEALRWNHMTTYTAFLYLLDNDVTRARTVAADIKPYTGQKQSVHLRPAYQFLAAYLQRRLLDQDTSSTLNKLSGYLNTWFGEYQIYTDFDIYHARMREIVADMASMVEMGWLQFANLRLDMNEMEAIIAEMADKGDQGYQTALVLANAYNRLGYGERAEPLARAAFDAIQAEGWFTRTDHNARYLTDSAYEAVFSALLMQGRFGEAADCIMQIAPRALYRNVFLTIGAWNYYLAGDRTQTRAALDQMKPVKATVERGLNPNFQLVYHYLNYRLGIDPSSEALINQAQVALHYWQEPLNRLVDNPYRKAVQAMVDDVQAVVDAASIPAKYSSK